MPDGGVTQPLPEDFAMRGQLCSLWYYPEEWFEGIQIDIEERSLVTPSMAATRIERILWLGMGIASVSTMCKIAKMKSCIPFHPFNHIATSSLSPFQSS